MPEETGENDELFRLAVAGDGRSWEALVGRSRHRLRRMVAFRLDQRLRGRVDPSDVLQDAYLTAWSDLGAYLRRPEIPFFLWLRGIAGNTLRELHRHHLGTQMRDPRREVSIHGGALAETTTTAIAAELLGDLTRPERGGGPRSSGSSGSSRPSTTWTRSTARCWPCGISSSSRPPRRPVLGIKEKAAGCATCGRCGGSRRS